MNSSHWWHSAVNRFAGAEMPQDAVSQAFLLWASDAPTEPGATRLFRIVEQSTELRNLPAETRSLLLFAAVMRTMIAVQRRSTVPARRLIMPSDIPFAEFVRTGNLDVGARRAAQAVSSWAADSCGIGSLRLASLGLSRKSYRAEFIVGARDARHVPTHFVIEARPELML